jgi:hypothetical protein
LVADRNFADDRVLRWLLRVWEHGVGGGAL